MDNNQRSNNFLKEVRCAVLDTSNSIRDPEISTYMRQTTYNFLRNNYSHYRFKIYEENSVDKILMRIRKDPWVEDIKLVVIQAYGNVLYDTWKPLEQGYSLLREYCNHEWIDMAEQNKFLLMGHILDERESKNRWYRLHEQCFVINFKMWQEMGYPKFGNYHEGPVEVHKAVRSEDNVHDNHTPTILTPGMGKETIEDTGLGWHFISKSLESGLPVLNFDEQARKTKTYLYPEIKEEQEEFKKYFREDVKFFERHESNLGMTKKDFLQYQSYTIRHSPKAVWVMNTESVNDVIFVPRKYPIKNLYSVAAGFKTFAFLRRWNTDTVLEDVNINYFDISPQSLEVRKWLHEEWDPSNFDMYLDYLHDNWYHSDRALISIYEDFNFLDKGWKSERERAREAYKNSLLRIFDKVEEFYEMHERIKNNNITYTVADLCKNYMPLISRIEPHEEGKDSVVWSSNYITTRYTTWLMSYEERRDIYKEVVRKMHEKNPNIRLHSADWDGTPTKGMSVEEIVNAYELDDETFLQWRQRRN